MFVLQYYADCVYPAESFNGFQSADLSSSNNHATTLRGTVSQNRAQTAFRIRPRFLVRGYQCRHSVSEWRNTKLIHFVTNRVVGATSKSQGNTNQKSYNTVAPTTLVTNMRFGGSFQSCKLGPIRIYIGKALSQTEIYHHYTVECRKFGV